VDNLLDHNLPVEELSLEALSEYPNQNLYELLLWHESQKEAPDYLSAHSAAL
jgi:hypothetical protein